MTAKTWTPPPKMPADLPPLPMGRNGRPLVYLGIGGKFIRPEGKKHSAIFLNEYTNGWEWCDNLEMDDSESNYAAESDSEVCRLNQWGDFTPEAQNEPVKAAPSTLDAYLLAIESAIEEADQEWQKAMRVAAAWENELKARMEIRDRLHLDPAQICEAWYRTGRIDGRSHAPCRKTFPIHP